MEAIWTELIRLIPSIMWFVMILIIFVLFYRPIRDDLLPNISSFKAMGVEFSFVKNSFEAAIELGKKSPEWKVDVPSIDKEHALNRAKKHLKIFQNSQILWVDDHPENNLNERRMFRQLKTDVDIAKDTDEALEILKKASYQLVISDIARDGDAIAGLKFLERFRKVDKITPVIFYIGVIDPDKGLPLQAFGITNRPDELLQLTLDALERTGY